MTECFCCTTGAKNPHEAVVFDTSGASNIALCTDCRRRLDRRAGVFQQSVCVVCAEHAEPTRARGMLFNDQLDDGSKQHYHLCDSCRSDLLHGDGAEVEVVA